MKINYEVKKRYSSGIYNEKIVTNKDDKDGFIGFIGFSELDKSEQTYSWKTEPKPIECKYIDFGMF